MKDIDLEAASTKIRNTLVDLYR